MYGKQHRRRPGQAVEAGQVLGLVGLLGQTECPHVDFPVRHDGALIDPFVGQGPGQPCGQPGSPLWAPELASELTYRPTRLLRSSSFFDAPPDAKLARRGGFRLGATERDPAALVLWVDLFGLQRGDVEWFSIVGPGGIPMLNERKRREESRVSWFSFAGVRRPKEGWPSRVYQGKYRLLRDGTDVARADIQIEITR